MKKDNGEKLKLQEHRERWKEYGKRIAKEEEENGKTSNDRIAAYWREFKRNPEPKGNADTIGEALNEGFREILSKKASAQ